MKKTLFKLTFIVVFTVFSFAVNGFSDDDFPPDWRGNPGSYTVVFDEWLDFFSGFVTLSDANQSYPYPDQNSLGPSEAERIGAGIMSGLEGRTNVVYINQQNGLIFKLPNFPEQNPSKLIRLQITYLPLDDVNVPYEFDLWLNWGDTSGSPEYSFLASESLIQTSGPKTGGWVTDIYEFIVEPNPPEETIGIKYTGSELLVDQVVIDTICERDDANIIQADFDYWATPEAVLEFGSGDMPIIPADFFGPGSEPFNGSVIFRGLPLGPNSLADTIIERQQDSYGISTEPVNIELTGLSLKSVEPITITYNNGNPPEEYNVYIDLHSTSSTGQMYIDRSETQGGTFEFSIDVWFTFIFQPVNGEPASHWIQSLTFNTYDSYPWQITDPQIRVRPSFEEGFYPSGNVPLKLNIGTGNSYQLITYKDPLPQDLDNDRDVDFADLGEFAEKWLIFMPLD